MSASPYEILGVPPDATQDDIKAAYRALAKAYHPDLNPGDPEAERRFKDISAAFAIIGDPDQRRRYDAGEIDGLGEERRGFYRRHREGPNGGKYGSDFDAFDFEADPFDLFDDLLRPFGGRRSNGRAARGWDERFTLEVAFLDAARGARRRLTLPNGDTVDLDIPAGIEDGQSLRLRGKGAKGPDGTPAGDAILQLRIAAHSLFTREGLSIRMVLPLSPAEAVLGAQIMLPTIHGPVKTKVPGGVSSGRTLRLKGMGIRPGKGGAPGDHLATVRIVLPDPIDPDLKTCLEAWQDKHGFDPRADWVDDPDLPSGETR